MSGCTPYSVSQQTSVHVRLSCNTGRRQSRGAWRTVLLRLHFALRGSISEQLAKGSQLAAWHLDLSTSLQVTGLLQSSCCHKHPIPPRLYNVHTALMTALLMVMHWVWQHELRGTELAHSWLRPATTYYNAGATAATRQQVGPPKTGTCNAASSLTASLCIPLGGKWCNDFTVYCKVVTPKPVLSFGVFAFGSKWTDGIYAEDMTDFGQWSKSLYQLAMDSPSCSGVFFQILSLWTTGTWSNGQSLSAGFAH